MPPGKATVTSARSYSQELSSTILNKSQHGGGHKCYRYQLKALDSSAGCDSRELSAAILNKTLKTIMSKMINHK
jgi:hypothetical protein